jgi:hypothetical protein
MKSCVWSDAIYNKGGLKPRPQPKSQRNYKVKLTMIGNWNGAMMGDPSSNRCPMHPTTMAH